MLVIIGTSCSENKKNKINKLNKLSFKPEIVIGNDTTNNDGWFVLLNDFCVLPNGDIYGVDYRGKKVKVFNKNGNPLFSFGRKGRGPGEFLYPTQINAYKDKYIFVSDPGRKNISKFNIKGEFIKLINFKDRIVKFEIFNNGNIVVETVKIIYNNLSQSLGKLQLLNNDLITIKSSIYEKQGSPLAWVTGTNDGQRFTTTIPFHPSLQWDIIQDRLYVGFTNKFEILIFNENGTLIGKIKKEITPVEVRQKEKENWKRNTLKNFKNRPRISMNILSKSLDKIQIPNYKPAFSKLLKFSSGLGVIVPQSKTSKTYKIIFFNKKGEEIREGIIEYNDFKYFYGKYYRRTGGKDKSFTITRYQQIQML